MHDCIVQYDGDVEQSSLKRGEQRLRATVDGDAKRNRRHSSDESAGGGSVTELDTSKYLRSYQQSTPMQPGIYTHCTHVCSTTLIYCHLLHSTHAVTIYMYTSRDMHST